MSLENEMANLESFIDEVEANLPDKAKNIARGAAVAMMSPKGKDGGASEGKAAESAAMKLLGRR